MAGCVALLRARSHIKDLKGDNADQDADVKKLQQKTRFTRVFCWLYALHTANGLK